MKHIIELPVVALKAALPGLAKVISSKSYLPAVSAVRIVRAPGGIVTIHGSDLDSFVRYQVDVAQAGPPAQLLVPLAPLRDIVKAGREGETIDFTLDEDDRVTVSYPAGTTRLSRAFDVPYNDDWPQEPADAESTVSVDDTFKRALREALDCCGHDESRAVLRGAFVEAGHEAGHLVGTDGRHMYCANSFTLDLPKSVILPGHRFLTWPEFVRDGQWTVGLRAGAGEQPTWVSICSNRWRIVTRSIEGQYPNWRSAPPSGQAAATIRLSEPAIRMLTEVVPRLPVASEHNQTIGLAVRSGALWLQHRPNERDDWSEIPIPEANVEGPDCAVRFNRIYLLKGLRWGLSEIQIRDANIPLILRSDGRQLVVGVVTEASPPSGNAETPTNTRSGTETSAGPPSGSAANTSTEQETKPMANPSSKPTPTPTPAGTTTPAEPSSPLRALVDHFEKLRGSLRDLQGQMNETAGLLKAAERQQRTTEQEVESVRRTLRGLQKVQL